MSANEIPPWEDDFSESEMAVEGGSVAGTNAADVLPVGEGEEPIPPEKAPLIDEIAMECIGFWNRLVSQTNWEKGRVIQTWRTKLLEAGLPRSVYSDESIAKRIGNVSSQHVGRLRRVFERFGDDSVYRESDRFANLYWSHYQAALDWEDAEEWLEKASQEGLSIALMRIARWEKYGAPKSAKPKDSEIVDAEPDEDVNPMNDSDRTTFDVGAFGEIGDGSEKSGGGGGDGKGSDKPKKKSDGKEEDDDAAFDYSGDSEIKSELERFRGEDAVWNPEKKTTGELLRSYSELTPIPNDLAEPFEALKVAILEHKLSGWETVPREDILKRLAALRAVVLANDE